MDREDVTDEVLFAALLAMRRQHPAMRFGQMVCNVASMAHNWGKQAAWDVEDHELVNAIRDHLEQCQQQGSA